jgi:hypothetical protein
LFDLRSSVQRMPANGQLREVHAVMCKLQRMPASGQLKELGVAMCILIWKMLHVLMFIHFCISIGSRKCVTRIVRLTRASKSNCWKSVAKKFKMLTVKHVVPSVNWIAQTKVGTK